MAGYDARRELRKDGNEDWECDRLDRFSILFTVVLLDSSNEAPDDGRLTGCEGKIGISVEGTNGSEVGFNGFGLDTSSEVSDPRHDSILGGREDRSVRIVEAVETNEVDKLALTG
jgi:hypothetical protein